MKCKCGYENNPPKEKNCLYCGAKIPIQLLPKSKIQQILRSKGGIAPRFVKSYNRYGMTIIYIRGRNYLTLNEIHSIRTALNGNEIYVCPATHSRLRVEVGYN